LLFQSLNWDGVVSGLGRASDNLVNAGVSIPQLGWGDFKQSVGRDG